MSNRLSGHEAIEYVEALIAEYGWAPGGEPTLSAYPNWITPDWRHDLSVSEAREIAREYPALVYYDRLPA